MISKDKILSPTGAGFALLAGGAMWGFYWVPVRALGQAGLDGAWLGLLIYLACLALLVPFLLLNLRALLAHWKVLLLSGLFTGAAFGLYTTSLSYTEVAKSILLFYLTPVWGTLLGLVFLGERITLSRALGLLFGLLGLVIILSGGGVIPIPRNIGDWMALISGVSWAIGTLILFQSKNIPILGQILGFLLGGIFITLLANLVLGAPPLAQSFENLSSGFTLIMILTTLYVLPMMFLTLWPATLLTPARVGLLLMSEVVVGIFSAALFSGEPFGWREALGATFIIGAAVVELSSARH